MDTVTIFEVPLWGTALYIWLSLAIAGVFLAAILPALTGRSYYYGLLLVATLIAWGGALGAADGVKAETNNRITAELESAGYEHLDVNSKGFTGQGPNGEYVEALLVEVPNNTPNRVSYRVLTITD